MRKLICIILAIILFSSSAYALDFPTEKAQHISGSEIMELLDEYVFNEAPSKISSWKNQYRSLRESKSPLIRFDAMAALFLAAQTAGQGFVSYDPYEEAGMLNHNWDEDYISVLYNDRGWNGYA